MRRNVYVLLTLAFVGAGGACSAAREGMEGQQQAVARVDGHTLTIDRAAALMAAVPERVVPAAPAAVDVLTGYWISYTLLVDELLSADSLEDVDVEPLIQLSRDQEIVWKLRQDVILSRTELSDSELRSVYEREQPYTSVEAQHILIRVPDTATPAQRDSLRRVATEVQARARAGEDFDELARQYSDDPTTAPSGGRMGWLRRGQHLPEIEAEAFALQPGEVSETVRSAIGYHILKATDRQAPDFETVRDDYRATLVDQRAGEMEAAYIDSLRQAAKLRIAPGAVSRAKRLTIDSRVARLTPAERRAVLVHYRGGALTVGEYADFVIKSSQNTRRFISGADSAAVDNVLRELVRNKLLVAAARKRGHALSDAARDSLHADAQRQLYASAVTSGLRRTLLVADSVPVEEAVDQAILAVLNRQRSPIPVIQLTPALRRGHVIQVYPDRFPRVVERLQSLRQAAASGAAEPGAASSGQGEEGS